VNDELDTTQDPPRLDLSDDAPDLAMRAMRAARSDVPKPEDLSRMEALLMARIAALGAGGAGGAGGVSGAGGTSGTAGAGTSGAGASTAATAGSASATTAAVGGTSFTTLAGGAAVLALVGAAFVGKSWLAGSPPVPPVPSAVVSPVPCVAVGPVAAPGSSAASASSVPVLSVNDLPLARSAEAKVQAAPVDEAAETKLLGDAQSALKSDPAAALRACTEHAKRFPGGALAQEREALAIEALVRLGRKEEASKRLARFRTTYPSSGHLRKLEGLLWREGASFSCRWRVRARADRVAVGSSSRLKRFGRARRARRSPHHRGGSASFRVPPRLARAR
jgi:hypothetical protein